MRQVFLIVLLSLFYFACSITPEKPIEQSTFYKTCFVGDSIMAWDSNLTIQIADSNRAIPGNTIQTLLNNDTHIQGESIYIWVGCNSLGQGLGFDECTNDYTKLINIYKGTFKKIYCISVLKINYTMYTNNYGVTKHALNMPPELVDRFNSFIANISEVTYINVVDSVTEQKTGQMIPDYTRDGIHPSEMGYQIINPIITNSR